MSNQRPSASGVTLCPGAVYTCVRDTGSLAFALVDLSDSTTGRGIIVSRLKSKVNHSVQHFFIRILRFTSAQGLVTLTVTFPVLMPPGSSFTV
jgi:hypothetical protein